MHIEQTALPGLIIITPDIFRDERGEFLETFQDQRYQNIGIPPFVQDNLSVSKYGVLRGLHYQIPPFEQGKLVQVVSGRVIDVAVDIRHGSPTFGRYFLIELSAENHKQLWIPSGFAHGFLALETDTRFYYKCTHYYSKEHERGIQPLDPNLDIPWGIDQPHIAVRDQQFPLFVGIAKDFIFDISSL